MRLLVLLLALAVLGLVSADFKLLGNAGGNAVEAMRTVWDSNSLTDTCFAKANENYYICTDECLSAPLNAGATTTIGKNKNYQGQANQNLCCKVPPTAGAAASEKKWVDVATVQGQYNEFTTYFNFADDSFGTLKKAAQADLSNPAARKQVQYFARRLAVASLNKMIGSKNGLAMTFPDCKAGAADTNAERSRVNLWYDDATRTLQVAFDVHIPQYWVAATTQADQSVNQQYLNRLYGTYPNTVRLQRTSPALNTAQGMRDGYNSFAFQDLSQVQTLVNNAIKAMPGSVSSQLVKALSPNMTPSTFLRSLLLKVGKQPKVTAAVASGQAKTVKGP